MGLAVTQNNFPNEIVCVYICVPTIVCEGEIEEREREKKKESVCMWWEYLKPLVVVALSFTYVFFQELAILSLQRG